MISICYDLTARLTLAMASVLGVALGWMVLDLGTLGRKSGETIGQAPKGTGGRLKRLFGGKKKPWTTRFHDGGASR